MEFIACRLWAARLLVALVAYAMSVYGVYIAVERLSPGRPGFVSLLDIMVLLLAVPLIPAAASIVVFYSTRSFTASLSIPVTYIIIASMSPFFQMLLLSLWATVLALASLIVLSQFKGGFREPLLDVARAPRTWSPTALASAALTLYLSDQLLLSRLELGCEFKTLYYASTIAAALIASSSSTTLPESLTLGLLSGLGPLGLLATAAYSSMRPLNPPECVGVRVGSLVGFTSKVSEARALVPAKGYRAGGELLACSRGGHAILELEEPWIIWVYGRNASLIGGSIMEMLGGGAVIRLGSIGPPIEALESKLDEALRSLRERKTTEIPLGGVEPPEARIVLAPSLAHSLAGRGVGTILLDLQGLPLRQEDVAKVSFETSKKVGRLIVALSEIPWTEPRLAPLGPARSSAFIIASLSDPAQAETIARILSPAQAESLKEYLVRGDVLIAYPGCGKSLIAFQVRL